MTGSYTPTGPFNPALPPGITAAFLNNIEAWIKQVDNTTAVTVAGTTSGTATLYQPLQGTTKAFMVYLVNYRNSTTTEQVLTLPVPFTRANYLNGNIYINLYKSGGKITNGVAAITTLNSVAGTGTVVTTVPSLSLGELAPTGGFDALGLTISMAGPTTGILFAIGF